MDLLSQPIRAAFEQYDREVTIGNFKVACILGILLVPSFAILDFSLYPDFRYEFLAVRFICSSLIALFLIILLTKFGKNNYRFFAVTLVLLPGSAICYMISRTPEGAASPYYAGLNLVLLMTGFVLRWSFQESLIAVGLVVLEFLLAGRLHGPLHFQGVLVNNLFFLLSTAIIVATGNFFYSKFRYREFAYRYQLDLSKRELEATNLKLADQNEALNRANREIKDAEAQLVQAEKMSSLGRFSAGLMHDILNPLNYSQTGLFTLQKKSRTLPPAAREEFDQLFTDIKDGMNRVQELVQSLRNFTHPGEQAPESIDLSAIFSDVRRFVAGGLKDKNISLEVNIPAKQMVWIGQNDFSVVVINLLENSIDALESKPFTLEEKPVITVASRSEGDRTVISIRDNGPGIDAKIITKIFDPFFTTKDVGKGTGLGLSICFGIIRSYGGTISVNSESGKFCEFTLDLPANEAAAKSPLKHAD